MRFYPEQKTGIFIDGLVVNGALKGHNTNNINLGKPRQKIEYQAILEFFRQETTLVTARFYMITEDTPENKIRPLMDYLSYNGYLIFEKNGHDHETEDGRKILKGRLDVEMTTDMLGVSDRVDQVVIFGARADLAYVVRALQAKGVRVTVIGMDKSMVADELRRQADEFITLEEIPGALSVMKSYNDRDEKN